MPASPLDVEAQISGGGNRWLLETSYFACRVLELVSAGTILSPWKNKTIRIAPLSLKINSLFIFLGLCVVVFHCNCVHHRRRRTRARGLRGRWGHSAPQRLWVYVDTVWTRLWSTPLSRRCWNVSTPTLERCWHSVSTPSQGCCWTTFWPGLSRVFQGYLGLSRVI